MNTNILEVRGLNVRFGPAAAAVNDINFNIARNEVFGLVGESGSGKTLTALSILRLLPEGVRMVGGSVLFRSAASVGGEAVDLAGADEEALRRLRGSKISMVFQDPSSSLNPVMTAGHQVVEAIRAHRKVSDEKSLALEYMARAHVPHPDKIFYDYPHQLSGGTKQRIMIAMALVNSPELLILDEPTTALDVTVQAQILSLLEEIRKKERLSMLFISHDFGVVSRMCDSVAVMRCGRIVESGSVNAVLKNPKDLYTKNLLESVKALGW